MCRSNPAGRDHEIVVLDHPPACFNTAIRPHLHQLLRIFTCKSTENERERGNDVHLVFIVRNDLDALPAARARAGDGCSACMHAMQRGKGRGTHSSTPCSKQYRAK